MVRPDDEASTVTEIAQSQATRGSPTQHDSSAPQRRNRGGRRWAGHGDGLRRCKSDQAARGVGAYRARRASNLGHDATVESWRSYGGGEWAMRHELALALVLRRAGASSTEPMVARCECCGKRRKHRKRQSACGGQQGVLHFKLASARRGQGEPSAWRPCGGHLLASVGHDRPKIAF